MISFYCMHELELKQMKKSMRNQKCHKQFETLIIIVKISYHNAKMFFMISIIATDVGMIVLDR